MDPPHNSSEDLHYLSNMPHKPVEPVTDHVEGNPYSDMEDFKWCHDAVILLCSLYRNRKEQFVSGFVKKRDLWAEVAADMVSHGFPVNFIACEKKWHNICATFRKLREYNRYCIKKRKCWAYYEIVEEILNTDGNIPNDSANKPRCPSPENACPSTTTLTQSSISIYGKSLWPSQYRATDNSSSESRPRSCEQDITSMLSVTLEENQSHSQESVDNSIPHNGTIPSHICIDDFKWTHNSVMLLCSMYIARKEQFLSGTVKKRDLWSDIALQMNQEGFPVTFVGCEKKWHNLIATYKKVVLYNKKKTWPYLHIFQKILEEQQESRAYLNNPEYVTLSTTSFNKVAVKQALSLFPADDQSLYNDSLNNSNDSFDDFKWTHASVISLCTLYKERRRDFQSNAVRKRDLWTDVANEMNLQGYCVTWVHCEKKWYNLYATYKKVTDQNRKRVRIWSTWPYLQLFQDIFSKNSSVSSQDGINSSINHTYESESGASQEVCSPSPSNSDRTCDMTQDQIVECNLLPSKRPRPESPPPVWFLDYCQRQKELEERRKLEMEQQHREILEAINKETEAVKSLSDGIKMFLNKCL